MTTKVYFALREAVKIMSSDMNTKKLQALASELAQAFKRPN
jgi:hypothetical protein